MGAGLIDNFIRNILAIPFCPLPFCPRTDPARGNAAL